MNSDREIRKSCAARFRSLSMSASKTMVVTRLEEDSAITIILPEPGGVQIPAA
jgi:hypothetical protein